MAVSLTDGSLEIQQVADNMHLYPPEENECCSRTGKFRFLQTIN